jgi:hypothetical protein
LGLIISDEGKKFYKIDTWMLSTSTSEILGLLFFFAFFFFFFFRFRSSSDEDEEEDEESELSVSLSSLELGPMLLNFLGP